MVWSFSNDLAQQRFSYADPAGVLLLDGKIKSCLRAGIRHIMNIRHQRHGAKKPPTRPGSGQTFHLQM